jgi:hypothetical protein
MKRDLRALYKPRGKDARKRGRAQTLDGGTSEALRANSAIRLSSVPSTPLGRDTMDISEGADRQRPQTGGHQTPPAPEFSKVQDVTPPEKDETRVDDLMSDNELAETPHAQKVIDESIESLQQPRYHNDSVDLESLQDEGRRVNYTKPFTFNSVHGQEEVTGDAEPLACETSRNQQEVAEDTELFDPESSPNQEMLAEDAEPFALDERQDQEEAMDVDEAQAVRNKAYLAFDCEEEDDYTDGPARFVLAVDGIKHCAALLMTYELSKKIQKAIHRHRKYLRAENAGISQRQSLSRLENGVRREISSCSTRLAILEEENRLDSEDGRKLGKQLETLELMLSDVQGRREAVLADVEFQARQLWSLQAAANVGLKEAFICANLMERVEEESEPESERLDVHQEYENFCRKLETAHGEYFEFAGPPLDTNTEHLEIPPASEEEQARQEVINALWAAKETLDLARRDFEERKNIRAREFQANQAAADRGEPTTDATPDDFDVRWVVRYGELTRDLINAEAAYAEIKRSAFEAGVPLPFEDNETVCEAMEEDDGVGYTISKEQELVASVPSPTVRRWLDKVPEGVEVGSPSFGDGGRSQSDEWEAEEVGISDSVSLVAEGRERARIDRWRKACVGEKQE